MKVYFLILIFHIFITCSSGNVFVFWHMQFFRSSYIRSIVVYLTGITFLNLSFLQVEVTLLKHTKNHQLIENIALLLSASEEERECGETKDNPNAKEVDLISHQSIIHHTSFFVLTQSIKWLSNEGLFNHAYLQKFSPPPEV